MSRSMSTEPVVPIRYDTVRTEASPAPTSYAESAGKSGRTLSPRAVSPSAVPQQNGIENQAMPPRKYARAVVAGLEAMALDQYPVD